jgi:hypothetical protein
MNRRPVLAALLALLVPFAVPARADDPAPVAPVAPSPAAPPARPAKPELHADAWRDEKIVAARFDEALAAVEKACGAKFETKPTFRLSTKAEVKQVLLAELEPFKAAMGLGASLETACEVLSASVAAKYDVDHAIVHVVAGNVETLAKALGQPELATEESLRVVLAHECVHALDFPRFHWKAKRVLLTTAEQHGAFGAVIEGHAQFVAKRVAEASGLTAAFDRFTKSITALPPDLPTFEATIAKAISSQAEFAYDQGATFLEAVFAARGEAGLLAALEEPPQTSRAIEHPDTYLHPDAGPKPFALTPVFDLLRGLTSEPAWTHMSQGVLEGAIRGQLTALPDDVKKTALDGFEDATILMATHAADGAQAFVLTMRFAKPEQALAFAKADRQATELRDAGLKTGTVRVVSAKYEEGAGTGGKVAGCVVEKQVEAGPMKIRAFTAIFAAGPIAFELAVVNVDGFDRAGLDPMVDALASFTGDPAHPMPKLPEGFVLGRPAAPKDR